MNVIIVGAGPVGCYAGFMLAKIGHKITILDQKDVIGLPVQCTGIITHELLNITDSVERATINKVSCVEVNTSTKSVKLPSNDIIIDRGKFDKHMAKKAGCQILMNHKAVSIYNSEIKIYDKKSKKSFKMPFDVLIGADGPDSVVFKHLNPNKKRKCYIGAQARVKGDFDSDVFKTYFGKIAPRFFGWIVPESKTIARVGISGGKNLKKRLDNFVNGKVIEYQGGKIPLFDPTVKICKKNVYLIGDAAGFVKATTGGGIVQGLMSSKLVAESIAENKSYKWLYYKKLFFPLLVSLMIRKKLNRFKEKDYNKLIEIMNCKSVRKILKNYSRDSPIKLALCLLTKKPSLIRFLFV